MDANFSPQSKRIQAAQMERRCNFSKKFYGDISGLFPGQNDNGSRPKTVCNTWKNDPVTNALQFEFICLFIHSFIYVKAITNYIYDLQPMGPQKLRKTAQKSHLYKCLLSNIMALIWRIISHPLHKIEKALRNEHVVRIKTLISFPFGARNQNEFSTTQPESCGKVPQPSSTSLLACLEPEST